MKNRPAILLAFGVLFFAIAAGAYFILVPMAQQGPDPAGDLQKIFTVVGAFCGLGIVLVLFGIFKRSR